MQGGSRDLDGCTAGAPWGSTYDLVLTLISAARDKGVAFPEPEDFEAKIIAPLKWDILKMPHLLNPSVEAKMAKVARFLRDAFFGDSQSRPKPQDFLSEDEIVLLDAALWP